MASVRNDALHKRSLAEHLLSRLFSHALEDIVSFASVTHVDIPACGHVRPPAPAVVVISEKPELVFGCSKPRVSQLRLLPESWVSAIPQAQP